MQLEAFLQNYLEKGRKQHRPEGEPHILGLQRLLDYLGAVEVEEITTGDMRRFTQFLLNNYSTKTRQVTLEVAERALSTWVMPTRRRSRYFSKKVPGVSAKT